MSENGRPMPTSAAEAPSVQPLSQAPAQLTHDDLLLLLGRATAEVAYLRAQLGRAELQVDALRAKVDQASQQAATPQVMR